MPVRLLILILSMPYKTSDALNSQSIIIVIWYYLILIFHKLFVSYQLFPICNSEEINPLG